MLPIPPVTQFLMLGLTAAFCVGVLLPSLAQWLALWPLASGLFMPWQLVSYGLLHGDMVHLFFNVIGLWMFGSELERLWGTRRYLQFLLVGLTVAALVQLGVTMLVGSLAPTVGASGALFALLLACGMLFPNRTIVPLFPPIPMRMRTFVIIFGALELLLGTGVFKSFFGMGGGGVAHFAHLGGMLGGWLMIRYWRGQPPFGGSRGR